MTDETLYLPGVDADCYIPAWELDDDYYGSCKPGPAFYPSNRRGRPVYLSGVSCAALGEMERAGYDVGLLLQPGNGYANQVGNFRLWAADNGCFAEASGKPWDEDRWFAWLSKLTTDVRLRWGCWGTEFEDRVIEPGPEQPEPMGCLFATAPDVVGDPVRTWARSEPWFHRIRELGLPVALVAQDGLERFPNVWDEIERWDCLFIGGSTDWKISTHARDCIHEAQSLGKWVHMGRVNSAKRARIAAAMNCDSMDGTYLGFGPTKNAPKLAEWLDSLWVVPVEPAPTWIQELRALLHQEEARR